MQTQRKLRSCHALHVFLRQVTDRVISNVTSRLWHIGVSDLQLQGLDIPLSELEAHRFIYYNYLQRLQYNWTTKGNSNLLQLPATSLNSKVRFSWCCLMDATLWYRLLWYRSADLFIICWPHTEQEGRQAAMFYVRQVSCLLHICIFAYSPKISINKNF